MLDDAEILNIVTNELTQAVGSEEADSIDSYRWDALAAYLGDSQPPPPGRSGVVSTDVADAIEWIMPEIVKAFTQNNEVVTFDANWDGDEDQAELESQFVYDVLMKDNDGFIIIHEFIKDALMQQNGFLKVHYEAIEKVSTESYTGLTEIEYNMIIADPKIEVLEETITSQDNIPIFDVKVRITDVEKKLCVQCIPPEEFRFNKLHNSVNLSKARFTAHVTDKTRSDLIKEGYDRSVIEDLPSDGDQLSLNTTERFILQGEQVEGETNIDTSLDLIQVAECFMQIDINEDGIAELCKVTIVSSDNIGKAVLDWEEVDEIPFISATAILMSHKVLGLSIYDRLIEIQNQKTALWRNILDNMYLQNNQRTIVLEGQVNLDDLMISRPGGIVRATRADAVIPYTTPQLSGESYKMMDYLDKTAAGRSGVSPDGTVQDFMIGDRVGSEGIERMMSQKEELVGLMVRVIAETGIKPLCYMIRNQLIKHQDIIKDYKFRGKWVKVDPRTWSKRSNTTVRVGTGSGNRKQQLQTMMMLAQAQQQAKQIPGQTLVTPENEYNLLNDMSKAGGLTGASKYFMDPASPQGQQLAQQTSMMMQQEKQKVEAKEMELAQAEVKFLDAQGKASLLKIELEQSKNQLSALQSHSNNQIALLKQQLEEAKAIGASKDKSEDLEFKYWDANQKHTIALLQMENQKEIAEEQIESQESMSQESSNEPG